MNKTNNMIMIVVAAAVLVALNLGVFMAAGNGTLSPINNILLWGAFVVLNVASILWAVSMLGLQPLVISISYVAGGALAFLGVRGMGDVSVAEITTAGATYGAFGALAVGNATAKVRLAFFNKGQVPFIFIIAGLLVIDGVLNSQVSSAGAPVLLNAVLLPFVLAGGVVGLGWSVMNRYGIGRKPSEVLAERDAAMLGLESDNASAEEKVVIPMPAHAAEASKDKPAPKKKVAEPVAPVAKPKPAPEPKPKSQPVVEPEPVIAEAAPVKPKKEEEFFPLEIDKNEEPAKKAEKKIEKEPEFVVPVFDAALYASGSEESAGGVMVDEPAVSVETEPEQPIVEKEAPAAKPAAKAEPAEEKSKADDFLGGHLDLLNKLK